MALDYLGGGIEKSEKSTLLHTFKKVKKNDFATGSLG
jgi:hypothetical protein